jgi:cytochrome d ubiquinol oxidase subunit II
MLLLLGITARGTAFTFRYYDIKDQTQWYYTFMFRSSSVITSIFLGIVLGAVMMGQISTNVAGSFYELFMHPWLNFFTFSTGIFICLLFGWLASTYLLGETKDKIELKTFRLINVLFFLLLFVTGVLIFVFGEYYKVYLFRKFANSPVGLGAVVFATLLIPIFWIVVKKKNKNLIRLVGGAITTCIFTGWFAVQFPVMVFLKDSAPLTISNTKAPESTMYFLIYALGVGILIIFPAFAYLFKVFKFARQENSI